MPKLEGTTIRKYRLLERVGKGGMAEVYKAYQPGLNRYVAVKIMHDHLAAQENFVSRFEREATSVARLRHPNIIQVHDFDTYKGMYYMVMEFMEGQTLKDGMGYRRRGSPNTPQQLYTHKEIAYLLTAVASGLDYAHAQNVIHRDLKPGNIMFTAEGQAVITDFGLVHLLDGSRLTAAGTVTGTPAYMSPEQAQGDEVDHRSDIYSLGILLYELLCGHTPFQEETALSILMKQVSAADIPSLDHLPDQETIQPIIDRALHHDPAKRYQSAGDLAVAFRKATHVSLEELMSDRTAVNLHPLQPTKTTDDETADADDDGRPPDCPYRGLFAFREEDADFFFGRELFTDRLYTAAQEHQFLPVIGPSGSGKSSVLFAGLTPRLRHDGDWLVCKFRPGSDPFFTLSEALLPLTEAGLSEIDQMVTVRRLAQTLRNQNEQLNGYVNRALQRQETANHILIIIDQFEELYTLCGNVETRRKFLDMLTTPRLSKTYAVAFSLRADFLGSALNHPELAHIVQTTPHILGAMSRKELSQAIENPAVKQGVFFEAGLPDRILDDVGEEPGNLPLLEFALTLLWDNQSGRRLTHAAYDQIGRVDGALARHAEAVFQKLPPDDKERIRTVFTQLVSPGEGTEDTRRLATREEIGDKNWPLVRRLAGSRLVVTNRKLDGTETAEVVHEALLRSWRRLKRWMNEDRAFRVWQERLRTAVRQWESNDRDDAILLRGNPLSEAEGWLQRRADEINEIEETYIQTGLDLRQARIQERETRRRRMLFGLTAGFVAMLLLAVLSFLQRNNAIEATELALRERDQAQNALSRQLALQADLLRDDDFEQSLLLSAAAFDTADTLTARETLLTSLTTIPRLEHILRNHAQLTRGLAYSADGRYQATGGVEGDITIWDTATSQTIVVLEEAHSGPVRHLEFNPETGILASAAADEGVTLWDWETQQKVGALVSPEDLIISYATYAPDGRYVATANDQNIIKLWDTISNQPIGADFVGHSGQVTNLEFSRDGSLLLSGSVDGQVIMWDVESGRAIHQLDNPHEGIVWALSFKPDTTQFVTGGVDGRIILWDTATGEPFGPPFSNSDEWITSLDYSPDGLQLAAGNRDGSITVWNMERRQPDVNIGLLVGHEDVVWHVKYNPNGGSFSSAGEDGKVNVWNADPLQRVGPVAAPPLNQHTDWVYSVAYGPGEDTMVSGSRDGTLIFWDMTDIPPSGRSFYSGVPINTLAYSPDGRYIASAGSDGDIILWDATLRRPLEPPLSAHVNEVWALAFSPDGRYLVSAGEDNRILIWDMNNRDLSAQIPNVHDGTVWVLAFAPDSNFFLSGAADGRIGLWDVTTAEAVAPLQRIHNSAVTSIAFSQDGELLATAGEDRVIWLWDGREMVNYDGEAPAPEPISEPLIGHNRRINDLAFNPDGTILASGASGTADVSGTFRGEDDNIVLWDVASRRQIGPSLLTSHGRVFGLAFSPDGRYLISSGWDTTVLLWDADPVQWKITVCRRVNRDFTPSEWTQFFGSEPYRPICRPHLNALAELSTETSDASTE